MKQIILLLVTTLLLGFAFISCEKTESTKKEIIINEEVAKDWYSTGYVNPKNNKEFIVNDSLVIKSGDLVTLMTIFCHGRQTKCEMFQELMENDSTLISHLQWQYEHLYKEERIYKPAVVGGFK